jgi:hypothetical protein
MSTRQLHELLARIALLPDRESIKYLTTTVLQGKEDLPQASLGKAATPLGEGARWDSRPIRDLIDEAMARFEESPTHADAWLAPRLHSALRMPRRKAAERGLWNHLGMCVAPDYVFWRHLARPSEKNPLPQVNPARFNGAYHSQTFARLWWAAELFRNGTQYRPVELACGNQDVLNTVLRLDLIYHRPSAQAIVRMLEQGDVGTGREINALAKAVNSAGSTLFFEVLAPDEPQDVDAYRDWIGEARADFMPYDSLPDGPDDGSVPDSAVEALFLLFAKLFAEAPVRGKSTIEGQEDSSAG